MISTDSGGNATTTTIGTLSISTNAWIANLSARANVQGQSNLLVAGFVTGGTANKSVLVRGCGPSLSLFGIGNYLPDPQLVLGNSAGTLATAQSWSTSLQPTFAQVGAFGFVAGSHDAALLESLAPGSYTAQIASQAANSGVALAEIYDADTSVSANRLINISARAFVGTGSNILIGGFIIEGSTPQTVLIRADGPALAGFGVYNALANPTLTLGDASGVIATNTGWTTAAVSRRPASSGMVVQPMTAELAAKVGAFPIAAGSGDSAIIATLPPGDYTVQVDGANNSFGIALLEIYELR